MTFRVERIGDRLGILLTQQEIDALSIAENDHVEIQAVNGRLELRPATSLPRHLESYRRTRPDHEETYRELAK